MNISQNKLNFTNQLKTNVMRKNYLLIFASLISIMMLSASPTTGLQFTGASASYLNCGENSAFAVSTFTVEAWVYYEKNNGSRYIISNEGHSGELGEHGFSLRTSDDSKIELAVGAFGGWPSVKSTTTVTLDTWIHVAATCSGTELKMYVNGVEEASTTLDKPMTASNLALSIGEGSTWKDRRFTGKISDVRLWNVVRAQANIEASMSTPLTGMENGLVANWKMDEGTGNLVADLTGNHNVTKPDEVLWFGNNASVSKINFDEIKTTISGNNLRIENNYNSQISFAVYNVIGQKITEDYVNAGELVEKQLFNSSGVFVVKFIAVDGASGTLKFKM